MILVIENKEHVLPVLCHDVDITYFGSIPCPIHTRSAIKANLYIIDTYKCTLADYCDFDQPR